MSDAKKTPLIDVWVQPTSEDCAIGKSESASEMDTTTHRRLAVLLANLTDESDSQKLFSMVCPETGLNILQFAVLYSDSEKIKTFLEIFGPEQATKIATSIKSDQPGSKHSRMPALELAIAVGRLDAVEMICDALSKIMVDLEEICIRHDAGAALIWLWKEKGLVTPTERTVQLAI